MTRVLVVGAGLGGYMAGLSAARNTPDADVRVLSTGMEQFRRMPGTVDLLGYVSGEETPVKRPLERLSDLGETHPYRQLGTECVRDALAFFDAVTGESYDGGGSESNALMPTCTGDIRPTNRYPAGLSRGLLSDEREMLLIGLKQVPAFDAYYVQDRLGDVLPYSVGGVPIEFPLQVGEYPPATRIARSFDEGEMVNGEPIQAAFIEEIRNVLDIEPRVGFPAVLGQTSHDSLRETIADRLNVEVFEIPIGPPSIPGLRLEELLRSALADAGVSVETGSPKGYESTGNRITAVHAETERTDVTYEADVVVLATGGLDGPGLIGGRNEVREPLFDCHAFHSAEKDEWTVQEPLGDQPFASFGVSVGEDLRPRTEQGDPEFENLFAVGSVIGGHNFTRELSRSGVAIVSGYGVGELAGDSI